MKKTFTTIALFILFTFSASAQNRAPEKIIGIWVSEDNQLKVEIYKAGPQYFVKQVSENSDSYNLIIIRNLDYDRGIYVGGLLYNYKTGKTYNSLIKLNGENALRLRVYATASLFGRTTKWTRVQ